MRYLNLILIVALGVFGAISCSPDQNVFIDTTDNLQTGIVVRTLELEGTTFNFFNVAEGLLEVDFEIQPAEGETVAEVQIYADFQDNTFFDTEFNTNGTTAPDEVLLQTITAADLTVGRIGFPSGSFSYSYQQLLDALGLQNDLDTIFDSDQFIVRIAVVMDDGRVFSNSGNNSPSLEDGFFTSPFRYFPTVVCPTLVLGDITIEFEDTEGDGWDGAEIIVTNNGEATSYTLDDGGAGSVTFTIPPGTDDQTFVFSGGGSDDEVGYTIIRESDGRELANFAPNPPDGPPNGAIELNTGENPCVRD